MDAATFYAIAGLAMAVLALVSAALARSFHVLRHRERALAHRQAATGRVLALAADMREAGTADEQQQALRKHLPLVIGEASGGVLYLFAEGAARAESVAQWGAPQGIAPSCGADECLALRRGGSHEVRPGQHIPLCAHVAPPVTATTFCRALKAHGEVLGVLHVQVPASALAEPGELQPVRQLVDMMAQQVALEVSNLRVKHRLASRGTRDALTGLHNHEYMVDWLEQELHRARRGGYRVSAIMIWIEAFEQLTARSGEAAGDFVLCEIAELLDRSRRRSDLVSRTTAHGFALVMPNANKQVAIDRAEQIRAAIAGMRPRFQGADLGTIAASIGIAVFPDDAEEVEELLRYAAATQTGAPGSAAPAHEGLRR